MRFWKEAWSIIGIWEEEMRRWRIETRTDTSLRKDEEEVEKEGER